MNVKNNDLACIIDKFLCNFAFCLLENIIMEKINNNNIKMQNYFIL